MRFLFLLLALLVGCTQQPPLNISPKLPETKATGRCYLDWSNRISRPISEYTEASPNHAYSPEQFESIKGADFYCFGGRPGFTDVGYSQARIAAGSAPIIYYVNVLHTFLPDYYPDSPWPWVVAQGELFSGTHMFNVDGEPSVRWYAQEPKYNSYMQDPSLIDPTAYAELIASWVKRYPVEGLFLDYLAKSPWTYPNDPPVESDDNWAAWQDHQIKLVAELRRIMGPDFLLIANGDWAMSDPSWVTDRGLSGVFWERMGSIWWDLDEILVLVKDRPGIHLWGPRQGGGTSINVRQLAQTVAALEGGYFVYSR